MYACAICIYKAHAFVWFCMTLCYSACIILSVILLSVRLCYDYFCMSVWLLLLYVRMDSDSARLSVLWFRLSVRTIILFICVKRFYMSVWIIILSVSLTYDFARYISVTLVRTMFISVTFLLYILGTFSVLTPCSSGAALHARRYRRTFWYATSLGHLFRYLGVLLLIRSLYFGIYLLLFSSSVHMVIWGTAGPCPVIWFCYVC